MIKSRAEGRPRTIGRGPSGRFGAQILQARTSTRRRAKDFLSVILLTPILAEVIRWPLFRSVPALEGCGTTLDAASRSRARNGTEGWGAVMVRRGSQQSCAPMPYAGDA